MPQASVKRLIEADKQKLIELVLDIEKYKDFIPYCLDSKVYERNDKGDKVFIVADLTIGKGIFKDTYKSDVKYNKKPINLGPGVGIMIFKSIAKSIVGPKTSNLRRRRNF